MKLRTKLIFSVLAGSLVVSVLVGLASFYYTKSALEKLISSEHLSLASQAADRIDRLLFERYLDIRTIAGSSVLRGFLENNADYGIARSRFEKLKENTGPWDTILLADTEGNIIFSDNPQQVGRKIAYDGYPHDFVALKEILLGKDYYSDIVISAVTGKPTMIFASPVRISDDPDSEVIGAVIGQFNWTTVINVLSELKTTHAHIYNNRGLIIGSNLEEQNKEILAENQSQDGVFERFSNSGNTSVVMRSNEDAFGSLTSFYKFSGYREYGGNKWTLLLETPTSVAFAPARSGALIQALIICAMLPIFFLVIILIINRLVIKPLSVFTEVSKEIAKGNLDVRVDVRDNDEIGQLARAFNDMISELQSNRENIEKKVMERTADLEKINKFMVGREIKMIDLKKQIKDLMSNQCRRE